MTSRAKSTRGKSIRTRARLLVTLSRNTLMIAGIVAFLVLQPIQQFTSAAIITSNATGDFAAGGSWVGGVAPGAADEAEIVDPHVISEGSGDTFNVTGIRMNGGTLQFNISSTSANRTPGGNVTVKSNSSLNTINTTNTGAATTRIATYGTLNFDTAGTALEVINSNSAADPTNTVISRFSGVTVDEDVTVNVSGDATRLDFQNWSVANGKTLTKIGPRNLFVFGTGDGAVKVDQGGIESSGGNTFGTAAIQLNGGTLQFNIANTAGTNRTPGGNVTVTSNSSINTINTTNTGAANTHISTYGTLDFNTPGVELEVTNSNSAADTNNTVISRFNGVTVDEDVTVNVSGDRARLDFQNWSVANGKTLTKTGTSNLFVFGTGSGNVKVDQGAIETSAANTFDTAEIQLNGGTLQFNVASTNANRTPGGNVTVTANSQVNTINTSHTGANQTRTATYGTLDVSTPGLTLDVVDTTANGNTMISQFVGVDIDEDVTVDLVDSTARLQLTNLDLAAGKTLTKNGDGRLQIAGTASGSGTIHRPAGSHNQIHSQAANALNGLTVQMDAGTLQSNAVDGFNGATIQMNGGVVQSQSTQNNRLQGADIQLNGGTLRFNIANTANNYTPRGNVTVTANSTVDTINTAATSANTTRTATYGTLNLDTDGTTLTVGTSNVTQPNNFMTSLFSGVSVGGNVTVDVKDNSILRLDNVNVASGKTLTKIGDRPLQIGGVSSGTGTIERASGTNSSITSVGADALNGMTVIMNGGTLASQAAQSNRLRGATIQMNGGSLNFNINNTRNNYTPGGNVTVSGNANLNTTNTNNTGVATTRVATFGTLDFAEGGGTLRVRNSSNTALNTVRSRFMNSTITNSGTIDNGVTFPAELLTQIELNGINHGDGATLTFVDNGAGRVTRLIGNRSVYMPGSAELFANNSWDILDTSGVTGTLTNTSTYDGYSNGSTDLWAESIAAGVHTVTLGNSQGTVTANGGPLAIAASKNAGSVVVSGLQDSTNYLVTLGLENFSTNIDDVMTELANNARYSNISLASPTSTDSVSFDLTTGTVGGADRYFAWQNVSSLGADVTQVEFGSISNLIWDGSGDGNWTDGSWGAGATFPTNTGITTVQTNTVTLTGTQAARSLAINSGGVDVNGSLTVTQGANVASGGSLTVGATGSLTAANLDSAGTTTLNSGATINVVNPINVTAGTVAADANFGSGTLNVSGGAVTASGMTAGTLNVTGGTVDVAAGTVANLNVSAGTLTNTGVLNITTGNISGGAVVATSPLVVSETLTVNNVPYDVSGGTFKAGGADLATNVDELSLDGGALRIGVPAIPQIANLDVYLNLDESSGLNAADSSGNNRDGTLTSFPGDDSQWVAGQRGNGLNFIDNDEQVDIAGYSGVLGPNARTLSAWIQTTETNAAIMNWGLNSGGQKWTFRTEGSGQLRVEVNGGGVESTTVVTDGNPHHVVAVLPNDGDPTVGEILFYIDGVLETNSVAQTQAINTGTSTFGVRLGEDYNGGRDYVGILDEVFIYSTDLNATEVQQLFAHGNSATGVNPAPGTLSTTNVTVTATSTLNVNDASTVSMGNLTLQSGANLTLADAPRFSFNDVSGSSTVTGDIDVRGQIETGTGSGAVTVAGDLNVTGTGSIGVTITADGVINALTATTATLTAGSSVVIDDSIVSAPSAAPGDQSTAVGSFTWDDVTNANWDIGVPKGFTITNGTQFTLLTTGAGNLDNGVSNDNIVVAGDWSVAADGPRENLILTRTPTDLVSGPVRAHIPAGSTVTRTAALNVDVASGADAAGVLVDGGTLTLADVNFGSTGSPTIGIDSGTLNFDGTVTGSGGTIQLGTGTTANWIPTTAVDQAASITGDGSVNINASGVGKVTFSGTNSYTGTTTITAGELVMNATHTGGGVYSVENGGTLSGTGTIPNALTIQTGGVHAPGLSPGIQAVTGNYTVLGSLNLEIDGLAGAGVLIDGHDQVDVTGTVDVTGGTLNLDFVDLDTGGGVGGATVNLVLVNNDGTDAILGEFAGIPEGALVKLSSGRGLHLTYLGGDGNDIALIPEPSTLVLSIFGLLGLLGYRWRRRRN